MSTFRRAFRSEVNWTRRGALIGAAVIFVPPACAFAQAQRADTASDATTREPTPCSPRPTLVARALSNLYSTAPEPSSRSPRHGSGSTSSRRSAGTPTRNRSRRAERRPGGHFRSATSRYPRRLARPSGSPRPASRTQELFRGLQRQRPADRWLRAAAVCRPEQRSSLLALCRDHARDQFASPIPDFRRRGRLQLRLQRAVQFRRLVPTRRRRRRHLRRDGLVVWPDRIRPGAGSRAAALFGRPVPDPVGVLGHLAGLERELRGRVARPLV